MEINVCIPVLNNYSGLEKCIESINNSSVSIDNIYIINNGSDHIRITQENIHVRKSTFNIGVAASWNWFINNVPEYRIICNDDIVFDTETIERMIKDYAPDRMVFPSCYVEQNTSAFSCFLLPQHIIDSIGLFDEWISPNYAYFEDNDYFYRMALSGFYTKPCDARVNHFGSATLKAFNKIQETKHHDRFRLARDRYKKKWGGLPTQEVYRTPFGK